MIATLIAALCAPVAHAAKDRAQKVDVAAASGLGMPDQHAVLASCDCAELTWDGTPTQRLALAAADIAAVHHVVAPAGMHSLVLRTVEGVELVLEQAPCTFIAEQAADYGRTLGIVAVGVDAKGGAVSSTCAPPGQRALDWVDELASRVVITVAGELDVPMARVSVSAPTGDHDGLVQAASRELSKLHPSLGHCFAQGGDAAGPSTVVHATVGAEGFSEIDVLGAGTGAPQVDTCLVAAIEGFQLANPPESPVGLELEIRHER